MIVETGKPIPLNIVTPGDKDLLIKADLRTMDGKRIEKDIELKKINKNLYLNTDHFMPAITKIMAIYYIFEKNGKKAKDFEPTQDIFENPMSNYRESMLDD
jgi:hypothetical protein